MNFQILTGFSLIAIGAFTSGSFAVPFGKIKGWKWETYWMVYSFAAYIVLPLIACILLAPGFMQVLRATPSGTIVTVFLLGAVYGIGNLSFGLSLRYLGLSLGYALSLGLMMAIGTLIPPAIDGRLGQMMQGSGGVMLIIGIVVACLGIALSAWSGILKDKQLSDAKKKENIGEFSLSKGLLASVLVGITGSAMSLGFEQGIVLADVAAQQGIDSLFTLVPVLQVLLAGTFVTTLFWCGFLGYKNKTLGEYSSTGSGTILSMNYILSFLAGLLWFGNLILFGMGKSKMGHFSFVAWGISMALTIVFATVWGLLRKEWKGASVKVMALMILSLLIIIAASFLIGISSSE